MLQIGTVVMGVTDIHRAVKFWREALGYVPRHGEPAEDDDFVILDPPDGTGAALALDTSESPLQKHPRMHLDLYTDNKADRDSQVERLISLGGSKVDWDLYPEDPDFVVMADTEGNIFCVIDTSHE